MMQMFQFAPPSDNVWTVSIKCIPHKVKTEDGIQDIKPSLETLYKAILGVNKKWNEKVASKWDINLEGAQSSSNQTVSQAFMEKFGGLPEIFLAQDVNFSPLSVDLNHGIFPQGSQFGSFYNFGRVAMSRPNNRNLNISFLVSNWDICDILFDPWIAAVAQKGLIEDGQSSIKANIIIKEYTATNPVYIDKSNDEIRNLKYNPERGVNEKLSHLYTQMECRKQYKFFNCVPIKRGEISKNYEPNEAGTFKKSIVNFTFDDYKIEYLK
jgi:hypothetical protein